MTDKDHNNIPKREDDQRESSSPVCYMDEFADYFGLKPSVKSDAPVKPSDKKEKPKPKTP